MEKSKGLEVNQDLKHSKRAYKIKRIAMIILLILLILVAVGFTGHGPVSKIVLGAPATGALIISEKYTRYESTMEIRMYVNTMKAGIKDSMLDISFPASYLGNFTVEGIIPEPERTEISHNNVVFRFWVIDPGEAQQITFHFRSHELFKTAEGTVKIGNMPGFHLWHFIYP